MELKEKNYSLKEIALRYTTDKATTHNYTPNYEFHFQKFRNEDINLLEIGIGGYSNPDQGGGSLKMWRDYFTKANIYGFDIQPKIDINEDRIKIWQGNQVDDVFLSYIIDEIGELDIVVDDGSHVSDHVIHTFNFIFPRMKTGGIYVVEDTQTSYWKSMGGDYKNHSNLKTTMNYFKNLSDGLNFREFVDPGYQPTYYDLNITSIHFYHNLIFIYKGDNSEESNIVFNNIGNSWVY